MGIEVPVKHLEKAKEEVEVYLAESKCGSCVAKAEVVSNILGELIEMHKRAEDFVEFVERARYLKALDDLGVTKSGET